MTHTPTFRCPPATRDTDHCTAAQTLLSSSVIHSSYENYRFSAGSFKSENNPAGGNPPASITQRGAVVTSTSDLERLQLDFDPDELRAKYAHERDRRIRTDGTSQFVPMTGKFEHLTDDPFVEPGFTREPVREEPDVLIIGSGFAGMQTAARLRYAGRNNFRILDSAGDFGGTWYWNR
jgi:hypothetical protein